MSCNMDEVRVTQGCDRYNVRIQISPGSLLKTWVDWGHLTEVDLIISTTGCYLAKSVATI